MFSKLYSIHEICIYSRDAVATNPQERLYVVYERWELWNY